MRKKRKRETSIDVLCPVVCGNVSQYKEHIVAVGGEKGDVGGWNDGGVNDSGVNDGGENDNGVNCGSADGDSGDGGSTDGGSANGGSADGGSTDRGSTDGGSANGSGIGGGGDGYSRDGGVGREVIVWTEDAVEGHASGYNIDCKKNDKIKNIYEKVHQFFQLEDEFDSEVAMLRLNYFYLICFLKSLGYIFSYLFGVNFFFKKLEKMSFLLIGMK